MEWEISPVWQKQKRNSVIRQIEQVQSIDREKYFVAPFVAPGIFEKLHYLMGMEECMINFYDKPEVLFYFTGYV